MTGNDPRTLKHFALTDSIAVGARRSGAKMRRFFKGRKSVKLILPMLNL